MKASELRIGNIVTAKLSSPGEYLPYIIAGISCDCILTGTEKVWFADSSRSLSIDDICPIVITKELLLINGFFIDCSSGKFIHTLLPDCWEVSKDYQDRWIVLFEGMEFVHIDYYHNLQNFFYIMTGSELIWNF